jgi:hypothetical protein
MTTAVPVGVGVGGVGSANANGSASTGVPIVLGQYNNAVLSNSTSSSMEFSSANGSRAHGQSLNDDGVDIDENESKMNNETGFKPWTARDDNILKDTIGQLVSRMSFGLHVFEFEFEFEFVG